MVEKKLLLFSLVAFVVSTVLCVFVPDAFLFDAFRLLQGMSVSGGIVIARAMATDKCRGKVLTKFLAVVSAINGVAPVTAPVLGGIILSFVDWRGTFAVLLVYGFALLFGSARVSETLPESRCSHAPLLFTFKAYGNVLKNPSYRLYLLLYAVSAWILFAYISASPFILQQGYGLSPMAFSFCFAVNAIAIGLGCAVSGKAGERKMILAGGLSLRFCSLDRFGAPFPRIALCNRSLLCRPALFFWTFATAFDIPRVKFRTEKCRNRIGASRGFGISDGWNGHSACRFRRYIPVAGNGAFDRGGLYAFNGCSRLPESWALIFNCEIIRSVLPSNRIFFLGFPQRNFRFYKYKLLPAFLRFVEFCGLPMSNPLKRRQCRMPCSLYPSSLP